VKGVSPLSTLSPSRKTLPVHAPKNPPSIFFWRVGFFPVPSFPPHKRLPLHPNSVFIGDLAHAAGVMNPLFRPPRGNSFFLVDENAPAVDYPPEIPPPPPPLLRPGIFTWPLAPRYEFSFRPHKESLIRLCLLSARSFHGREPPASPELFAAPPDPYF